MLPVGYQLVRMDSESSSSGIEASDVGDTSPEIRNQAEFRYKRGKQGRRESVTSVSTHPAEDAYVMVVQNRDDLNEDLKCALPRKGMYDVTFIVGEEKKPVHGVCAILGLRSRVFCQLIESHQLVNNSQENKSRLKKTLSKLSCIKPDGQQNGSDVTTKLIIPMDEFDSESFQRLMTYIHCGTLSVDAKTVIGLLNAAYTFGFSELRQACWDFAMGCVVRSDNLHDMFVSARRYANHTMTKQLMKSMQQSATDYPELLIHSQTLTELASEEFTQEETETLEKF